MAREQDVEQALGGVFMASRQQQSRAEELSRSVAQPPPATAEWVNRDPIKRDLYYIPGQTSAQDRLFYYPPASTGGTGYIVVGNEEDAVRVVQMGERPLLYRGEGEPTAEALRDLLLGRVPHDAGVEEDMSQESLAYREMMNEEHLRILMDLLNEAFAPRGRE